MEHQATNKQIVKVNDEVFYESKKTYIFINYNNLNYRSVRMYAKSK